MSPEALRFGISIGHGGAKVLSGARAFAAALERLLGEPVRQTMAKDYDDLLAWLAEGRLSIGWMPPLVLVRVLGAGARLAAVSQRDGVITYRSALLVRADSPLTLDGPPPVGLRAAWSDPRAAAGHFFPRLHLEEAGISMGHGLASETFYGSYAAACAAVADGKADVCGCYITEAAVSSSEAALAEVGQVYAAAPWRLRVLAVTAPLPPDGVALGPTVEPAMATRITDALLALHRDEDGRLALRDLMNAERLVAPTEQAMQTLARARGVAAAR